MYALLSGAHGVNLADEAVTTEEKDSEAALHMVEFVGGFVQRDDSQGVIGLDLSNSWVTDTDLESLAAIENLQVIQLGNTSVSDVGLEFLAPLKQVKVLDLRYADAIGDVGISYVKRWQHLEELDLRGTKVTSSVFEHIAKISSLKRLDVSHTRVSDEFFEVLADLEQLEVLAFGGNKMSGEALPLLKLLPALRELDVGGSQRTDSGLWSLALNDENVSHIAGLTNLEVLKLNGARIGDRGVMQLAKLIRLRELDLSETMVTSIGIASLRQLNDLRRLSLARVEAVDEAMIAAIQEIPSLSILDLRGCETRLAVLKGLAGHPGLTEIFAGGISGTEEDLASLQAALPSCRIQWWSEPATEKAAE